MQSYQPKLLEIINVQLCGLIIKHSQTPEGLEPTTAGVKTEEVPTTQRFYICFISNTKFVLHSNRQQYAMYLFTL